jgi:hypothetical protein
MSDTPMPQETVAEESAPAVLVTVTVIHPLSEDGRTHRVGAVLETTQARAERLVDLGLVAWPQPPPASRRPWWRKYIPGIRR